MPVNPLSGQPRPMGNTATELQNNPRSAVSNAPAELQSGVVKPSGDVFLGGGTDAVTDYRLERALGKIEQARAAGKQQADLGIISDETVSMFRPLAFWKPKPQPKISPEDKALISSLEAAGHKVSVVLGEPVDFGSRRWLLLASLSG